MCCVYTHATVVYPLFHPKATVHNLVGGIVVRSAPPRPPPPRGNPPPPRPPLPPRPNTASPSHTIGSSAVSAENSAKNQSAKNEAVVRKPAEVISQATKIGFNLTGSTVGSNYPNTALSGQKIIISSKPATKSNPSPKVTAASIFGDDDDDDDEEEEMPAAARMRMRNCGKFT